jgi:hypothetical protein
MCVVGSKKSFQWKLSRSSFLGCVTLSDSCCTIQATKKGRHRAGRHQVAKEGERKALVSKEKSISDGMQK